MTKYMTCTTSADVGLGNRIKNLFSFLRKYNPTDVVMIWPDTGWVSMRFMDLFSFDYPVRIYEFPDEKSITDLDCLPPPSPSWRFWVSDTDPISRNFSKMPLDRYERTFDLEYNRTPQCMIDAYSPFFQALKPTAPIKEIIDSVKIPSNTVAVQIRNNSDWGAVGRDTSLKHFVKYMKKYDSDTYFFLSAMNPDVSAYIKSIFGNRIIEIENKDYQSMYYAVADLYLIAKCNRSIFSCGSTFAEIAWWLGGCKSHVTVVGNYSNWDEMKNIKTFWKRMLSVSHERKDKYLHYKLCLLGVVIKFKRKAF